MFGNITLVDASDPFRVLIFNKDFNKISFLDNKLTEIASPVLLDNLGFFNVSAVCNSNNGGFWIFDQNLNELVYFDKQLNLQKKSSQLTSLFDPEKENTGIFMLEKNDYIYLGIKDQGVLFFDSYGAYIKTFPIIDIESFQVIDTKIIYFSNNKLNLYDTKSFTKEILDLPIENCINSRIVQDKVFLQTNEKILVYQLGNY